MNHIKEGLRGVSIGQTSICTVGEGHDLFYRGYDIIELANKATFEEVVYLLLNDRLPNRQQLDELLQQLHSARHLTDNTKKSLELIPKTAHPMDVMRIGTSMLGAENPEADFSKQYNVALKMIAAMTTIMAYWHRFVVDKIRVSTELPEARTISQYMFYLLQDRMPTAREDKALNISLILYAEHEINASTFTARVVAATLADIYSAVAAAIGALKGPLHGGANEAVMDLLCTYKDKESAKTGILEKLKNKEKIMGFGHAVYQTRDPRNVVIKSIAEELSSNHKNKHYYTVAETIEAVIQSEKKLFPNLDFYSACSYHFLNIPTYLFTPIFVCARVAGWCAHIFEQRANNKLIRPTAEYTGAENQTWIDIDNRQ